MRFVCRHIKAVHPFKLILMKLFSLLLLGFILLSGNCKKDVVKNEEDEALVAENGELLPDPEESSSVETGDGKYFVAVDGDNDNPGTKEAPWATWQKAFSMAGPGDTVYIRGGIYYADAGDRFGVFLKNKRGSPANPVCVFNFPNEIPVLNCSKISSTQANVGLLFYECSHFYLKGLTIRGVSQHNRNIESCGYFFDQGGVYTLENCVAHGNDGAGFRGVGIDSLFFINCDAFDNFDVSTTGYIGGQADGFVSCFASKTSYTHYKGCRSWYNSDDGFDCWENEGVVVFEQCWAFNNGRGDGDGGGFKLGKTVEDPLAVPQRILTNCLAFDNRFIGFNQNDGNVKMVFYNNCAFNNSWSGFSIGQFNVEMVVRNNISYKNGRTGTFTSRSVNDHNSWNASSDVTLSEADFISLDTSGVSGQRQPNGELPVVDFMKLAEGSDLIDAGIDVGLPFSGNAPDFGAFEKKEIITHAD